MKNEDIKKLIEEHCKQPDCGVSITRGLSGTTQINIVAVGKDPREVAQIAYDLLVSVEDGSNEKPRREVQ